MGPLLSSRPSSLGRAGSRVPRGWHIRQCRSLGHTKLRLASVHFRTNRNKMEGENKPSRRESVKRRFAFDSVRGSLWDGVSEQGLPTCSKAVLSCSEPLRKEEPKCSFRASNSADVLPRRVRLKWLFYKISQKNPECKGNPRIAKTSVHHGGGCSLL